MYPGVDPADEQETKNPEGSQEPTAGNPVQVKEIPLPEPEVATNGKHEANEELNKAVKEAFDDMFVVGEAWKPRMIVKFVINCPSGQKVLVKHLDILDLAAVDLIEDMDLFSKKLIPSKFDAQGNPVNEEEASSIWKTLSDVKKRHKFLDMSGRLMEVASIKPHIVNDGVAIVEDELTGKQVTQFGFKMDINEQLKHFGQPIPPLQEGQTYAGAIGFGDRMAFFVELQKPLGMIEPFREEQAPVLADMEPEQGIGVSSE